ncbi:hypothetical protein SACS_1203 [Parasaccharibacter apium]|uniref:Uncharacterized protein n=1 Tax=Parasaccharibacter apium TaxID=1510841 RepID=A0A7U7G6B4_9PROT|nr:hypothetical protein SACS_1203 [Parasaccharibacter apium]
MAASPGTGDAAIFVHAMIKMQPIHTVAMMKLDCALSDFNLL